MKVTNLTAALIAVTALLSLSQLQAQTNNTPPPGHPHGWHHGMAPEHRLERLSEELNLTNEQKPKVQAVFEQMRQQIQEAFQAAKTNVDTQLQGILTPEQYQKFQSIWQEHQQHWGEKHGQQEGTKPQQ